ncbi:MAG: serine/threonine protein kinase, partial [Acidobacteriota bacterium]|nr:serine/threonine protein kinase [Acidobacteriota bacterium]
MRPQHLGRYRILEELGSGAMGDVYLAHDPQIDREIAIKTVRGFSELPEEERRDARDRFLQEARAAGKLLHPHIVTIFDVGEADGLIYLAMERVQGDTLDRFLTGETALDPTEIVDLIALAAETLDYAHRAGVVHRDIKPANLMRSAPGDLKVMDFGLALPTDRAFDGDNTLMGTPSYMSPEQIRGQKLDGRSDLFSLAVVAFELLSGQKPFQGRKISSIIYRIVNEPPREVCEIVPDAPTELRTFFETALAKNPADRFADGNGFAAAIRAIPLARATLAPVVDADATLASDAVATVKMGAGSGPSFGVAKATHRSRPRRSSAMPFFIALIVLLGGAAVAYIVFGEQLGLREPPDPREAPMIQATVITQPVTVEVLYDGVPVPADGIIHFRPSGPFGTLTAESGCRTVNRPVHVNDAATEIVLLLEPTEYEWTFEPGVDGATARVNGETNLAVGESIVLNLCRENSVAVRAEGYLPGTVVIAEQANPPDARSALQALQLTEIPQGVLTFPESPYPLVIYVDGNRIP